MQTLTETPEVTKLFVYQYPNEVLSRDLTPINIGGEFVDEEWFSQESLELYKQMINLMHCQRGVGLAANQVGLEIPVFVMNDGVNGDEIMINPKITYLNGKHYNNESCLSSPYDRVPINRAWHLILEYYNTKGIKKKSKRTGWTARIVQHETDHLKGICIQDHKVNNDNTEVPTN